MTTKELHHALALVRERVERDYAAHNGTKKRIQILEMLRIPSARASHPATGVRRAISRRRSVSSTPPPKQIFHCFKKIEKKMGCIVNPHVHSDYGIV